MNPPFELEIDNNGPNLSSEPISPLPRGSDASDMPTEIMGHRLSDATDSTEPSLAVPAELMSQAAKQGYLMKQGHRLRNWKRRYIFLAGPQLYYYKHPKDFKARGLVDLTNCTVKTADTKTSKQFSFEVIPSSRARTYLFYAENDESRKAWMDAILEEADKPKTMLRPHAQSTMFKTLDPFNIAKKANINAPAPAGSSNVYLQVPEFDSSPPITEDMMLSLNGMTLGAVPHIEISEQSDYSGSEGILSPTVSPRASPMPAQGSQLNMNMLADNIARSSNG